MAHIKSVPHDVKAVVWDMDGVIIDTEGFWPLAERKVFSSVGVPADEDFEHATTGLRTMDVIAFWYKKYPWDKEKFPFSYLSEQITQQMDVFIDQEGKALPNVLEAMEHFYNLGIRQAIASSSSLNLIEKVVNKLGIESYIESFYSGENEKQGKPAPDVYLTAAKKINVAPEECIVIEDSYNGALAGQRAGMTVFIIPDKTIYSDENKLNRFKTIEKARLIKSLTEIY